MLEELKPFLEKYKDACVVKYGKNLMKKNVFLNTLGEPHTESSLNKYWIKVLGDYKKFTGREIGLTLHQFRHTFCTMLYNADVDIKSAQAILGHSDVSVTLGVYTHLEQKQKSISIDKLNTYIQSVKSQSNAKK